MKFLRFTPLFLLTLLFISSCSKEIPDAQQQTALPASYRLLTPAFYTNSEDGASILVRFYESQRIYEVEKSAPDFIAIKTLLDANRESRTPVRVYISDEYAPYVGVADIRMPSETEISTAAERIIVPDTLFPPTVQRIIPDMDKLNEIFAYCQAQGCATGTCEIDQCISFQYVVDGCYARAHKMRQIMENKYGYSCEKVFSYGSLEVDAGDCCVYWWYHVAPLVTVDMGGGVLQKWVVDPSMFDEPVSIDTWTSAQESNACTPGAHFDYDQITRGLIYTPGGYTDNYYSSTNYTLAAYQDLVTCP